MYNINQEENTIQIILYQCYIYFIKNCEILHFKITVYVNIFYM